MNRLTQKQMIDKTTRNLQTHMKANKVKDRLEKLGYDYAVSIYGVIWNAETSKHEYRRIEVFINSTPTEIIVSSIRHFFKEIKPYNYYSIWAYNAVRNEIVLIEEWE